METAKQLLLPLFGISVLIIIGAIAASVIADRLKNRRRIHQRNR